MPVADLTLRNFTRDEFGKTPHRDTDWWDRMNAQQLVLLDVFRRLWGRAVTVSQHQIALGRHDGPNASGDHNVDRLGSVCAVDCFAQITDREDAEDAVALALDVGFSAVGVYPHWNGGIGLHLGHRAECDPDDPATWGAIERDGEQVYVALEVALNEIERG